MSQLLDYFKSLFVPNSRKRRRSDIHSEEIEPFPKYKRVTNHFPKKYNNFVDDEVDLFERVKNKNKFYNDILGDFLMEQQRKHFKQVLDDGEYSDEEDLNSAYRLSSLNAPSKRNIGYNFQPFNSEFQPSTSSSINAFRPKNTYAQVLNGKEDDDVKYVSTTKIKEQKPQSKLLPSLIPITKVFQPTSALMNGFSRESSLKPIGVQPARGRKSILDFNKKNKAFESPRVSNSILERNHNLTTKSHYEELLKNLIPRYPMGARQYITSNKKQTDEELKKSITTIDLSDDNDNAQTNCKMMQTLSAIDNNSSYKARKSDFHFKKPTAFIDLSDDETDQTHFMRSPCLSSTQIIKSNIENFEGRTNEERAKAPSPNLVLTPVNSLKERQSLRKSLQDDAIDKIVQRFNQKRVEKDKSISEEVKNASKLEEERIAHEKVQQKRIDESITSALSEKCIIIDEEEDLIDEFPVLTEQQNRFVNFALHGPRNDVIISKFNMNITRHDLATLDGLNWLNDEVINFYMELIKERSETVEHLPKVHVMNTFFLGKLLQQGHSGVRRWTRKVDIFSKDIIPIPVHVGGVHWCMSIIHMKNKTIKYYDSMGHANHVVLDALEQYLKDESLDKRQIPFDTSDWTIECVRDCPQQKNGSDCGVFSCQFAEFITRDSNISFEQQHMPYFRRKMICEIGSGKLFLGY